MSTERGSQCGQSNSTCATEYQYAVKIMCGEVNADPTGAPTVAAFGRYWTAINIHNPDKCREAHFRWKVVVALPLDQNPVVPLYQPPQVLGPDLALEIDCRQIIKTFPQPAPTFVKGYVIIESDVELDVVAVYTGGQTGCAALSCFHTERVQPRCVPVCEDLILPMHTGFAAWQTVAPTTGPLGPAVPVNPFPWISSSFPSVWVSQTVTDGVDASAGTRHYELCFDLCSGFTVPVPIQLQAMADNSATISLNNTVIGVIFAPGYHTPTVVPVSAHLLRAGRNCLRVAVTNLPSNAANPTGFALAGILRVTKGKCPCSSLPLAAHSPDPATAGS